MVIDMQVLYFNLLWNFIHRKLAISIFLYNFYTMGLENFKAMKVNKIGNALIPTLCGQQPYSRVTVH